MARVREGVGIVAGVVLRLSSAAHSFLGWASLGKDLVDARHGRSRSDRVSK